MDQRQKDHQRNHQTDHHLHHMGGHDTAHMNGHQMDSHGMGHREHMDGHDGHGMAHMNGHSMDHMHQMDGHHGGHDMSQMTAATKSMMKAHAAMFRRLFWISLALAVPTVALDPMFASLLHYSVPTALPWSLIPAILGTVLYFWPGKPFITGGINEIRQKKPGMMLLILLGVTVAFVASWLSTLGLLHTPTFWWELALLIVIMLAGHWIEMGSVAGTSSALDAFADLLPASAHVLEDASPEGAGTKGTENGHDGMSADPGSGDSGDSVTVDSGTVHDVPLDQVRAGQIVLVRPGEAIPADGVIVSGTAGVDESLITGESMPVTRRPGQKVVAGSVTTDSALQVRVTATGADTTLSTIRRLVDEAQGSKTPTQLLADKAAALLFWYALLAGAAAFLVWMLVGAGWTVAIERLVTVLVIACPHALGLAIPLVVSISMGDAAAHGTLFSKREALESLGSVTTVAFDKTGTLTLGTPALESLDARPGSSYSHDDLLHLAAAAESASEHPLARAIVRAATGTSNPSADGTAATGTATATQTVQKPLPAVSDFVSTPGLGVKASVDGHTVQVGGPGLLASLDLAAPADLAALHDGAHDADTRLWVVVDGRIEALARLADQVRPESKEAIARLTALGIRTVMITGDAEPVARSIAERLGIEQVFAGVRPEQKSDLIRRLQKDGKTAMVGDGVNDAPALAKADVGIAIGAGTDVAASSSDVVLAGSDPRQVARDIELSRLTVRKMRQNLWWAAGYNLISVPLAAGVLAWPPVSFMMPMSVGAALMALSTVIVVINANLLKVRLARLDD
jgi:Cu2+-exporting ATPase